jgi:hypothetical protein
MRLYVYGRKAPSLSTMLGRLLSVEQQVLL